MTRCRTTGRCQVNPTQAANIALMISCPCAPMLNSPVRNASDTASPPQISGVAWVSDSAIALKLPTAPTSSALYAPTDRGQRRRDGVHGGGEEVARRRVHVVVTDDDQYCADQQRKHDRAQRDHQLHHPGWAGRARPRAATWAGGEGGHDRLLAHQMFPSVVGCSVASTSASRFDAPAIIRPACRAGVGR